MIIVALGSNLSGPWGTPRQTLARAVAALEHAGVNVSKLSSIIETAPYGVENQPAFVNAVAVVETHKGPEALMRVLHAIERQAGRQRRKRWGPRTLDLDLIDYHGLVRSPRVLSAKPLRLPHPGAALRSFVLAPIAEVAPAWKHPVLRRSAAGLLAGLKTG